MTLVRNGLRKKYDCYRTRSEPQAAVSNLYGMWRNQN